jgi:hypothetical protein
MFLDPFLVIAAHPYIEFLNELPESVTVARSNLAKHPPSIARVKVDRLMSIKSPVNTI